MGVRQAQECCVPPTPYRLIELTAQLGHALPGRGGSEATRRASWDPREAAPTPVTSVTHFRSVGS